MITPETVRWFRCVDRHSAPGVLLRVDVGTRRPAGLGPGPPLLNVPGLGLTPE
ncbi:MAG: hypothetical protein HY673_09305 [Chloroflexi bacterium]|nr:hypothetical protein [Chloroflexota bacterium]